MKRFFLGILLFSFSALLWAQSPSNVDSMLTIGIKETPPFVEFNAAGEPRGLSLSFWDMVDDKLPARVEYRRYEQVEEMLSAMQAGEIDLSINPITVTDERLHHLDFSQPFFISGTAMARRESSSWSSIFGNLFSLRFFSALAVLLGIIFIFGFLVWLFERRANTEEFRRGYHGLFDGFWWSAVTMTTVGYGDKSPRSTGGRFIGFIWMFAAILLISGLTAGVASALTVTQLENKIENIEDLRRFKTATVEGSSTQAFLQQYGISGISYPGVNDGLDALAAGEIDIFVFDRPVLRYFIENRAEDGLVIEPTDLKTDYYSFAYPKGSPLRETLDPEIVRSLKSESWSMILRRAQNRP